MIHDKPASRKVDVVMIGAGPSALSAAVYTSRENLSTVLIEKGVIGGLAATTDRIENYPGYSQGISGLELSSELQKQAERFGAVIELGEVTAIESRGKELTVKADFGSINCRAVLIATGTDHKKTGVEGEEEFFGRGVHYCATCDGALYKDKRLIVIGGGNSALQESIFLTRFAQKIDILVRSDQLRASEVLQQDIRKYSSVEIHYNVIIDKIVGQANGLRAVQATDRLTKQPYRFEADGIFIFVGLKPNTDFAKSSGIRLDQNGSIITDDHLMTSLPGVFASGDVRQGATMQIASAVGEGATAALMIRHYLESL